nr:hypothetical protein Iba_chr10dCG14030 [Ipomoea batatas]
MVLLNERFEEIIVCIFDMVSAHRQCPPLFTSSVNGRKLGQNGGFPLQSPINGGDFAIGQHELTQIGLWRLRQVEAVIHFEDDKYKILDIKSLGS